MIVRLCIRFRADDSVHRAVIKHLPSDCAVLCCAVLCCADTYMPEITLVCVSYHGRRLYHSCDIAILGAWNSTYVQMARGLKTHAA